MWKDTDTKTLKGVRDRLVEDMQHGTCETKSRLKPLHEAVCREIYFRSIDVGYFPGVDAMLNLMAASVRTSDRQNGT